MKKEYILVSKAKVKKIYRYNIGQLKALLNDQVRNQLIDSFRQEEDPEKKRLLKLEMWAIIPHADDFTDDIRHDESAVPSKVFYTDFDSADNPHMGDPREYYLMYIAPQLDELHAIDVHVTVSGKGLHIGAYLPQNATIAQAQEWIGKMVGLVPDRKCTNLSRLFIAPKAEDYLYLDWKALFGEKEVELYTIDLSEVDVYEPETSVYTDEEVSNLMYNGIKAQDIVATTLQKIVKHPLPLVEGERNDTFLKAGMILMPLVKDTSILVKLFEPYGLSEAERSQVCKNAAKYAAQSNAQLSKELRNTIQELREEAGLTTGTGLLPCRPLPVKLPPLINVLAAIAPPSLRIPFIISSLPIQGAIADGVYFSYLDDVIHWLAFMAHIVGQFAGGKSTIMDWLVNHLLTSIREQDAVGRQAEREYVEALKKCKADERKPDDPKPVIRVIPVTISIAALLKRFDQSQGQTLISVCDEVDAIRQTNRAGSWSDKTVIMRKSFERGEVGQDYLSENSYSGIFVANWNIVSAGTEESTRKFYAPHVMDGLVSRVVFTRIESDSFAEEMPRIKPLTAKQKTILEEGIRALEAAEGKISIPRTAKAIDQWLVEKRQLAMETMSYAINALYKRSAVMGYRAGVIAYILCGYRETNVVINFALWVADYVLQQQVAMWGSHFENEDACGTTPVANLYKELPEEFTREELVNLRIINNQGKNVRMIIKRWKDNGMIQEMEQNHYRKTQV